MTIANVLAPDLCKCTGMTSAHVLAPVGGCPCVQMGALQDTSALPRDACAHVFAINELSSNDQLYPRPAARSKLRWQWGSTCLRYGLGGAGYSAHHALRSCSSEMHPGNTRVQIGMAGSTSACMRSHAINTSTWSIAKKATQNTLFLLFRRQRRLCPLQVLENASRGPLVQRRPLAPVDVVLPQLFQALCSLSVDECVLDIGPVFPLVDELAHWLFRLISFAPHLHDHATHERASPAADSACMRVCGHLQRQCCADKLGTWNTVLLWPNHVRRSQA